MGFFKLKVTCDFCGNEIGLNRYKIIKSNCWICPRCLKKAGGKMNVNCFLETKEDIQKKINNKSIYQITNTEEKEIIEGINKTHEEFERANKVKLKYKDVLKQHFYITDQLWNKTTYKLVNSQPSIFNKYAERYIELCNMYLQILPEYLEFDKEIGIAHNEERKIKHVPQDIVNMIRLLEKQEKFNEIINVSRYLLNLGLTKDNTKKGVKGRIEKAVLKFNKKNGSNYIYQYDEDLIIDMDTGEIIKYASTGT